MARRSAIVRHPLAPGFYVFVVEGGIDPVLHRRFLSAQARDQYMGDIYATHIDEEHNDLPCYLNVSKRGHVTMGVYARDFFVDNRSVEPLEDSSERRSHVR